jgi:Protein of unknown function (DUF2911)
MNQLRAFGQKRTFILNCVVLANLTVLPLAHGQDPYTHWICNAVRSIPGMPEGTTTGMPGRKQNDIWLDYYQHLANGETKVFGNLVPYDKVWLTDDAAAPMFRTMHDIMVGDLLVPAGSYSLYFLPSVRGWKLIVNKRHANPVRRRFHKDKRIGQYAWHAQYGARGDGLAVANVTMQRIIQFAFQLPTRRPGLRGAGLGSIWAI